MKFNFNIFFLRAYQNAPPVVALRWNSNANDFRECSTRFHINARILSVNAADAGEALLWKHHSWCLTSMRRTLGGAISIGDAGTGAYIGASLQNASWLIKI